MADDGRVLRLDQGSDVVSESQAYGMLVAELAGRDDLVPVIWDWTRQHLQRPDGLLSWHASGDGTVVGTEAASDADVLTAYALLRYGGEDEEELHADGRALAQAVLEHEVVEAAGSPVLAAGPWAVASGIVNPSYWMPAVFERLAAATGDGTWSGLAESSVALVRAATDDGRLLPPDWARLEEPGSSLWRTRRGRTGDRCTGPTP